MEGNKNHSKLIYIYLKPQRAEVLLRLPLSHQTIPGMHPGRERCCQDQQIEKPDRKVIRYPHPQNAQKISSQAIGAQ